METSTQFGANTLEVTRDLEHRLAVLAPTLAQRGVTYHPALLRPASFIESAIAKLRNSLLIGAVLVVVLLLLTLRDWRGALISFSAIPVSLLATVWILTAWGLSLNTMSLGGLVVALGVVVDDAVIDVENITRRRRLARSGGGLRALLLEASLEVRRPVFYATAAVAVAFLPIVMLSGLQGAFFRPLATAFLLAVGLSLLVAMSATPALCALLMQDYAPRAEPRWLRRCKEWQQRAIGALAPRARLVLLAVLLSGLLGLALLPVLGARLLPDFRENYLIAHAALRPGISLAETSRVGERIAARLAGIAGSRASPSRSGARRTARIRTRPTRASSRSSWIRRTGSPPRSSNRKCARCSMSSPISWSRSTRCLPSASARRCPAKWRLSSSASSVRISMWMTRSQAASPRCCAQWPQSGAVHLKVPPRQPELEVRLREDQLALFGLQAADVLAALNAAYHGTLVAQLNQADRSVPVVLRLGNAGADPRGRRRPAAARA